MASDAETTDMRALKKQIGHVDQRMANGQIMRVAIRADMKSDPVRISVDDLSGMDAAPVFYGQPRQIRTRGPGWRFRRRDLRTLRCPWVARGWVYRWCWSNV